MTNLLASDMSGIIPLIAAPVFAILAMASFTMAISSRGTGVLEFNIWLTIISASVALFFMKICFVVDQDMNELGYGYMVYTIVVVSCCIFHSKQVRKAEAEAEEKVGVESDEATTSE